MRNHSRAENGGSRRRPIGDYALIGDGRTAGLVSRDGSLDWLCLPRFDSPSVFGALLDPVQGGRFRVAPTRPADIRRRYVGETNVLETTFETETGVLRLTDCMPVASEAAKRRQLLPEHEVLRRVEVVAGEIEVEVLCEPRPDYGTGRARFADLGPLGFRMEFVQGALLLSSEVAVRIDPERGLLAGRTTLRSGERRWIALGFAAEEPAVLPLLGEAASARFDQTLDWWRQWAERCGYEGPFRAQVLRSALALKLLAYAPSGAVVAAPTTSLPETIGGVRNWDYRYCWLRDASLTTRAFFGLGYTEAAESFLSWLLHATRLTWPELRILYDVYGGMRLREQELEHLEGYRGSRPVRIGNAAGDQLQLDVYGEVVEAAYQFVQRGGHLDRAEARMLAGLGRTVCRRWREPDEGIWEIRSGRRHHTVSKAMCWLALDRLLRLEDAGQLRVRTAGFRTARSAIAAAIETRGYDPRLGSYVSVLDGQEVDASLLLLGLHGFAAPASPRMRGTCDVIRRELGRNGLLYRYRTEDDGLPGSEGVFGICGFWSAELRALQGDAGAEAEFEWLLSFANDVGLFAEEIDPENGEALGNFPQAFTHVGLINAALRLASAPGGGRDARRSPRSDPPEHPS